MASMPASQLPLFYNSLVPVSTQFHQDYGLAVQTSLAWTSITHAIPLTVDEFSVAQRSFPIIFGMGENPAPLALLSLTDGLNLYVDRDGKWEDGAYLPAFVRRYPFMLAKLGPDATELSLCFDDTTGIVSPDAEDKLFDGDQPTATTKRILEFCEQFEQSVARTRGFMEELEKLNLLTDGEVTIQQPDMPEPSVYRGFRMVAEEKLQTLRGDQARKMIQNGMMGLIYAHLFSLSQITHLFERQRIVMSIAPAQS
ncbi:SapC family protein [Polymorphobacter sp. PAMC 29334]|uniref:SapC family protein n=1 Tax=Polymorphobacter sp. PAMC 29334 TaxID=2862331 RepID=UPI001C6726D3|nr:SapC family protein [Polymorphobacter sp. PAMC 29334]QYE36462.1 SapC family protein [Polymorphobacter sp. PAMC 29334]